MKHHNLWDGDSYLLINWKEKNMSHIISSEALNSSLNEILFGPFYLKTRGNFFPNFYKLRYVVKSLLLKTRLFYLTEISKS